MDEKVERPKSERRKRHERKQVVSKEDQIRNSKMPEWQKREALIAIGVLKSPPEPVGKVSFKVYAKVKKIHPDMHRAMLAYPSVKGVDLATLKEWDEKLKGF